MLFLEEHLYTLLHSKIMRASVGGGLTGYKCETCLGTGKPWSGSYNFCQVWFDGLDSYPFRNTVSG